MPLFSSKFSFKKAQVRKQNISLSSEEEPDDEEESNEEEGNDDNSSDQSNDERTATTTTAVTKNKSKHKTKAPKMVKVVKDKQKLNTRASSRLKKTNKNKSKQENTTADHPLVLCVDKGLSYEFSCKDGTWRPIDTDSSKSIAKSRRMSIKSLDTSAESKPYEENAKELSDKNKALEEENRLLKLKIEILMEMVTETTAELNLKNSISSNSMSNKIEI